MVFRKALKKAIVPYVGSKYGPIASQAAKYLLGKPASKVTTPSAVIKNTALSSYLDRRYERKCGVEVKQTEGGGSPSVTTSLATYVAPCVGVIQGLLDSNRVGQSFELKAIQFKATFHAGITSTAPTFVRIIVCKQSVMQGAALTGAAVLLDPTDIRSLYLQDKQRSFTILKDFTFKLSSFNSGNSDSYKEWNWTYRPKHCHEVKWTTADTTGLIGNMIEGDLRVFAMYQQPTGAASGPTSSVNYRMQFLDS